MRNKPSNLDKKDSNSLWGAVLYSSFLLLLVIGTIFVRKKKNKICKKPNKNKVFSGVNRF